MFRKLNLMFRNWHIIGQFYNLFTAQFEILSLRRIVHFVSYFYSWFLKKYNCIQLFCYLFCFIANLGSEDKKAK